MAHDDFDVCVYKVLSYIMACAKGGVVPRIDKAKEVCGCNDVYWAMIIRSMLLDGFITGASVDSYMDGTADVSAGIDFGITQSGARYLRENEKMRDVARFLGSAFENAITFLVEATKAIM